MSISKQVFSNYIRQFNFRELFNVMGWNNDRTSQPVSVDNFTYTLQAVAEKSGFKILLCNPSANGLIPDYNIRKKIETKITKLFQEHLIIFFDTKKHEQIWQFVVRQSGKPTKVTETRYHISQDPELLYQRASGIFFEMDEEENITIVDVTNRMAQNFHANADKITKQFYDKFKREHTSFLGFIKGIDEKVNQEWYASLMLNRLMFCYFIQKKGFLDNNKNYLREKLTFCQVKKGHNKFYSFYRDFLLLLFHEGLNEAKQKAEIKAEIGKIPYLNGGLFDKHELEKLYLNIDIEDKAFERIFDFFDQYEWHLDTRISASGKDINPDVIGYIFEKYINDRANMGAYYTKEDITDYISKNSILPFLFDETKRHYPNAFVPEGELFQSLKQSGNKYIYDAVKKGVEESLPPEISIGVSDVSKRTEWNKTAPENMALPTEIWREVVDRRNRYTEIQSKIDNGEINGINDFITFNLNIRQFAQDAIENTNDPDFLRHFYKSINSVTIIDPTCGSGAFLFAAMNILEPVYEACIMRMRAFVEDEDRLNDAVKPIFSHKYKYFRSVLEEIQNEHHPNLQYFIYKSIILRNLYGVDIMKEAVEIAKLRLFLKLVASVEVDYRKPNLGLEPLPDIDFNIRAGNTLIGFATEKELQNGLMYTFDGVLAKPLIEEKCDIVARTFQRYKEIQLSNGDDYKAFKEAKDELQKRLKELNHELNTLLHKQSEGIKYDKWLLSHQPFHWFAEFYEIINDNGGFDVIIGNPPYVVYNETKIGYRLKNYQTLETKNLYAYIIERTVSISKNKYLGFIIPSAAFGTPTALPLRKLLDAGKSKLFVSYLSGDAHPAILFEGVKLRLSILLSNAHDKSESELFTTKYLKWYSEERQMLFESKMFYANSSLIKGETFPKVNNEIEKSIIVKIKQKKKNINSIISNQSKHIVYYHNAPVFFIRSMNFIPYYKSANSNDPSSNHFKTLLCNRDSGSEFLLSVLNSSTFFFWFTNYSANRDVTIFDIFNFPIFNDETEIYNSKETFLNLNKKLMKDININSVIREYDYSTGKVEYQEFYMRLSKPIIDEIDTALAEHYGFTAEELDFIINYDIKYRMGKELEEEVDD